MKSHVLGLLRNIPTEFHEFWFNFIAVVKHKGGSVMVWSSGPERLAEVEGTMTSALRANERAAATSGDCGGPDLHPH